MKNTFTQLHSFSKATFKKFKKLNEQVQFSGSTAAIGSIASGALLFVTIGNQAAGAACVVQWCSRVRFTDN